MSDPAKPLPVLELDDLRVRFKTDGGMVHAVNGVSFRVDEGEALGVVGESGCGKSVTNMTVLRLIPTPPGEVSSGTIKYRGTDLLKLSAKEIRKVRGGKIAMIFQDPMTCLNPFLRISKQLTEAILLHSDMTPDEARERAIQELERVGIPDAAGRVDSYPHEFSGGMRQRVMIAMALCTDPDLLIADEPTTALDVTIQAQILDVLRRLQAEKGMSLVLVTHDLAVVAGMCTRVVVMYAGRIVEEAPVDDLFADPRHPYTIALLGSVPRLDDPVGRHLTPIEGLPPKLAEEPTSCAFAPRCTYAFDRCRAELPKLEPDPDGRLRACFVTFKDGVPVEPVDAGGAA
ncbi:MAG: ABC transporter ATP-binding protein [Planctomycetes bacterium]|nr:ABC transporter ATP-binding protein [Planctomycetota bacterium]